MVKIILVTHGQLAKEMLETAGVIIGKPAEGFDILFITFFITYSLSFTIFSHVYHL